MMWRLSSATANGRAYSWGTGFEDLPSEETFVVAWPIPAQPLEINWDWWATCVSPRAVQTPVETAVRCHAVTSSRPGTVHTSFSMIAAGDERS